MRVLVLVPVMQHHQQRTLLGVQRGQQAAVLPVSDLHGPASVDHAAGRGQRPVDDVAGVQEGHAVGDVGGQGEFEVVVEVVPATVRCRSLLNALLLGREVLLGSEIPGGWVGGGRGPSLYR